MPERASVFNVVQIGREVTHGTAPGGGASRLLASMDLMPTPSIGVDIYRPQGIKYPTTAVAGKDLTTFRVQGKPTYTELVYPLSSLFGAATITGPNGDGAYTWTWNPSAVGADAFESFDVERGSAVGAERTLYTVFTQLGMTFDRDRADLSGAAFGLAQTTGITLTSTPTAISLIPISPKDISVFADTTSAGLGTTRLTRVLRGNWNFGQNKYNPLWTVDQSAASFAAIVESAPGAQFTALFEADATGVGFLANVRAGDTRFVRIRATGPLISGASNYQLTIDMAAKFGTPSEYRDEGGVYSIEVPWNIVYDATWTHALQVVMTNTLAAL
jgi:hypothetical protein